MSRPRENERPELIKLCTECEEADCSGEPCTVYRAMAKMLETKRRAVSDPPCREHGGSAPLKTGNLQATMMQSNGEIEKISDSENGGGLEQKRDLLKKYNDAIRGLDALTRDAGFDNSPECHAALELQQELEKNRREKFEILVDWDEIAERRKK